MTDLPLLRDHRLPALLVIVVGAPSFLVLLVSALMTEDLVFPTGGVLGGDFTAFWTAARSVWNGAYPAIYDPEIFEAALHGTGAAEDRFGLTWQYPPHAMLAFAPLAAFPYVPSYLVFAGAGLAAFALTLRRAADVDWRTIALVLLSPTLFQVVVCGQAGAALGALMLAALLLPERRPVLAGLCAGVLTVKPQLGVLIPVAYLAGGHYRSFATAAATALSLMALSLLIFGMDAWSLFLAQLLGVTDLVGEGAYPLTKMVTVFAALRSAGLSEAPAAAAQALAALGAMALCWRLWRGARPQTEKAAITAGLAFLCTPYAYHYDTPALALAFLLAARGTGFLTPGRFAALGLVFMTPLWMTGPLEAVGAQLGLGAVLLVTLLAARPDLFRSPIRPGSTATA